MGTSFTLEEIDSNLIKDVPRRAIVPLLRQSMALPTMPSGSRTDVKSGQKVQLGPSSWSVPLGYYVQEVFVEVGFGSIALISRSPLAVHS